MANEPNVLKYLFDSPIYYIKSEFKEHKGVNIAEDSQTLLHRPEYKGDFAKKILVILSSESGSSNSEELNLFSKTLSALKLSLEDIALIEISKSDASLSIEGTINDLNPNKLITFGEIPSLSIKKLHVQVEINGLATLHCSSLKTLSQKQEIKLEWWNAIKNFLSE